jgi:sporulation and spore germination protein
MRRLAPLLLVIALAGCGAGSARLTIYLPQRLGPEGPAGQRVPVLMPVERERRAAMSAARQAVLDVMGGPAPEERARGFLDTIGLSTRLIGVRVSGDMATVELAGAEPDYLGSAAIVYSVTELTGVQRVRLLLDGRPCCVHTHQGTPWPGALERRTFRGWTGEPCPLRVEHRCRD